MPGEPNLQYIDMPTVAMSREFTDEELALLQVINQKVAAADTLEEVVEFVFQVTHAISPCDRIGLAYLKEKESRQTVEMQCVRADYDGLFLKKGYMEFLEPGSSLRHVLESRYPRIINDLEGYLQEHPASLSSRLILQEGVRSSLTCPLVVENRPVGFLFRSARHPFAYDERQVLLSVAVAERVSQAVEKIRYIEELRQANRAYTEMLRFVSHELKSPLASMIMDAETLLGGYLGDLQPLQQEKVRSMVGRARYLLGLITGYLNLDRIERGGVELHVKTGIELVTAVLEPAIEMVAPQLRERNMTVERDYPVRPAAESVDVDLLQIVMVNLLTNAVKYGVEGGCVRVVYERSETAFSVSVWNAGPGFPPGEETRLFKRFSRLQIPELLKQRGSGIGLYTTYRIVTMHGGSIRALSEPGKWAEFVFEIPHQREPAGSIPHEGGNEQD
ncbi:MAG TPA: GAF domain-containing sensor histidine kinase [Candidatus Sumerlaeota bacterium]|nr:GAF domain-containing sensor histidine kinase [Candidatus Sumerlaeota bacterium]HPS00257.1 GAF domain-containing sensor histidine kinase [Candidatus Sumerlaeota bacterium]